MYAPHLESWQCLHTFQERSLNIVDPRSSVASITHVTLSLSATPPRPSAGPLYLPHPPAPPSLPLPPPLELVPPWFKVCCWSLIKGRPIPPFSFQPYIPYVLLLGQLVARARRHIEASAEGSEAACSGMGSHCHAARQSQAVSLLLLQSDPTQ